MNVDPLARWYRWLEYLAFGHALERSRFAFLDRLHAAERILILGEGDGRVLRRLLQLAPQARIDVVEISGEMIALARQRTGANDNVRFLQQDARLLEFPAAHYDGIVTCYFLDCFTEPEAREIITRLVRALAPGGQFLVSDFAIPPTGWRHWHARLSIAAMYRFFRVTTGLRTSALPPTSKLLSAAGLLLVASERRRAGMIISELWTPNR